MHKDYFIITIIKEQSNVIEVFLFDDGVIDDF